MDEQILKVDDDTIKITTVIPEKTIEVMIPVSSLLRQQAALQAQIDLLQASLDKINAQLSQAVSLGVQSAVAAQTAGPVPMKAIP
jgi:hypothetical protein